jgi:hypothetical protein
MDLVVSNFAATVCCAEAGARVKKIAKAAPNEPTNLFINVPPDDSGDSMSDSAGRKSLEQQKCNNFGSTYCMQD